MAVPSWLGGLFNSVGSIVGGGLGLASSKRNNEAAQTTALFGLQATAANNATQLEQAKIQQATALKIITYAGVLIVIVLIIWGVIRAFSK
jgi:hypothetical protein